MFAGFAVSDKAVENPQQSTAAVTALTGLKARHKIFMAGREITNPAKINRNIAETIGQAGVTHARIPQTNSSPPGAQARGGVGREPGDRSAVCYRCARRRAGENWHGQPGDG